jgi:hypothetical protein
MSDENLRRLLQQLHDELERTKSVDEKEDTLLRHLDADIRELLRRSEEGEDLSDEPMLERLQDTVDHFEDTNPTLTMALSEMMRILSNAGI